MRRDTKTLFFVGAVAALTLGGTMVAFAGTWKKGEGADQGKWRYDFEDGSYAVNGWQWIDGIMTVLLSAIISIRQARCW